MDDRDWDKWSRRREGETTFDFDRRVTFSEEGRRRTVERVRREFYERAQEDLRQQYESAFKHLISAGHDGEIATVAMRVFHPFIARVPRASGDEPDEPYIHCDFGDHRTQSDCDAALSAVLGSRPRELRRVLLDLEAYCHRVASRWQPGVVGVSKNRMVALRAFMTINWQNLGFDAEPDFPDER